MTQGLIVNFYSKQTGEYLGRRTFIKKINDEPEELGNKTAREIDQEWNEDYPLPDGDVG